VNGKVIDSSTGEPLPAAHIIIEGTKIGDVTDKNGAYSIENIPPGNYVLKASFIGYRTATAKITLSVNESVNQNFDLKPEAISVASLVVEAETELPTERNVINYAGARNVMDVAAIRKTAAAYTEEI
ncbi:MAG: PEGA domain-containing protein, partial [Aliifodinibius sp.]|nr:carboxypeptidase-like regulatory domain-containing protein [Fodinibius sp.]NIV14242.1 PEGA domain-containing protein [Fodinibius sp.]NIY28076.1 PEGA domain-containing protein [Fodinibius sp.]